MVTQLSRVSGVLQSGADRITALSSDNKVLRYYYMVTTYYRYNYMVTTYYRYNYVVTTGTTTWLLQVQLQGYYMCN